MAWPGGDGAGAPVGGEAVAGPGVEGGIGVREGEVTAPPGDGGKDGVSGFEGTVEVAAEAVEAIGAAAVAGELVANGGGGGLGLGGEIRLAGEASETGKGGGCLLIERGEIDLLVGQGGLPLLDPARALRVVVDAVGGVVAGGSARRARRCSSAR